MVDATSIRRARVYFEVLIGVLSLILNFRLIYISVGLKNKRMQEYNRIVIWTCAVDLFFTFINLVTMEMVEIVNQLTYYIADNPLLTKSPTVSLVAAVVWPITFYVLIVNIPMQFLYRFNVFCLDRRLKSIQFFGLYCVAFLLISLLPGLISILLVEETNEDHVKLLKQNPMFTNDLPEFVVGDGKRLSYSIIITYSFVSALFCYIISYWAALKIWFKFRENRDSSLSSSTIAAQRRLNVIMTLQNICLLVIIVIPLFLANLLTVFEVSVFSHYLGIAMMGLISFLPIFNSLSTILLTPTYRHSFFNRDNKTKTIAISSSVTPRFRTLST